MRALLITLIAIPLLTGCQNESNQTSETPAVHVEWSTTAETHRGADGRQYAFTCPPGGQTYTVWGSDVYTDDSSICNAAVHAGLFTRDRGGRVTIEIRPGRASYDGSTRNGATTLDYGEWGGSFVVVGP
jgi:hypothetical protein